MVGYKKYIDLIQFRLVILDEKDNVVDVLFTSKEYKPSSIFDRPFSEDVYECLMDAHQKYNFDGVMIPPDERYREKSKAFEELEKTLKELED